MKEAIKRALDLLRKKEWEACDYASNASEAANILEKELQALAAPVQEPVAWMNKHGACKTSLFREVEAGAKDEYTIPLYTTPPAQPAPVQEPLFWYRPCRDGMYEGPVHNNSVGGKMLRDEKPDEWKPLYTTPLAQRKPLTIAELRKCFLATNTAEPLAEGWPGLERFARAVEAAHGIKEKNHG